MLQEIKHYMTKKPRCVAVTDSVHRARQIMQASGIRHLPVLDGARVVGIVTERDIRLLETCGRGGTDIAVSEAMTPDPFVVGSEAPIDQVARAMSQRKLGSAVVMDDGVVVGIFSVVDALTALADVFGEYFASPKSDRWGNVVPPRIEP
ncbi:MAG: CBS domain-containing protein [Polyangiales bacterium]